jgi:hypothetical protein
MFSGCKFVTPYLKIVAFWLVLLVLVLAIVIVVSSDDENPRDAIAGTLIFFMIATVSYGYCTGFDWEGQRGALMLKDKRQGAIAATTGRRRKEALIPLKKIRSKTRGDLGLYHR